MFFCCLLYREMRQEKIKEKVMTKIADLGGELLVKLKILKEEESDLMLTYNPIRLITEFMRRAIQGVCKRSVQNARRDF